MFLIVSGIIIALGWRLNDLPGKDNLLVHNEAKGAMRKTYPLSWSLDIFIVWNQLAVESKYCHKS